MENDKRALIVILVGFLIAAFTFLATYSVTTIAFSLPLSIVCGVVIGGLSATSLSMELKRRSSKERPIRSMSRVQILLIALLAGGVSALFSYAVVEPDAKIKSTIISGLGIAIILYILINKEQNDSVKRKK